MQGEFTGLAHPVWSTPVGLRQPGKPPRLCRVRLGRSKNPRYRPALEKQLKELMIIAGTPKQVIAKLRILLEETRPGILGFWGNDGTVTHEDAKTCIRLMGEEVFPAVREMAKEFDLEEPVRDEPAGQRRLHERRKQPQIGRRRSSGSTRAPTSNRRRCPYL